MKGEIDKVSGHSTTGHEWNGIKELNTPMPKAFHIWLWLSIAVAVLLWLLYPSFPYVTGYAKGIAGYSSRAVVAEQVSEGAALRDAEFAVLAEGDLGTLAADDDLRARFEPDISVLYRDNCAACHGRDAMGQSSFPNLTDDHWLWSGTPEEIEYTIQVGINTNHPDSRFADMPAFGRDELLEKSEISDVIDYVLSLSGRDHDSDAASRGSAVFADNCASCHGDAGVGGLENGAPDLTDDAWIYGGDRASLKATLKNGRAGVMPDWSERLTQAEIRQLTLYILWQGADQNND